MDWVFLNFEKKKPFYWKLHHPTYTITYTLNYPSDFTINIDGLGWVSILQIEEGFESNIVFKLDRSGY